jgi:hypothetical protein
MINTQFYNYNVNTQHIATQLLNSSCKIFLYLKGRLSSIVYLSTLKLSLVLSWFGHI